MRGCNCPELKFINGVLHQSYVDDCGCKKWRKVPTEGGGGGVNGSLGSNLGGELLNPDGTPKEGGKLEFPPIDLGQRNFEITACSKATKLVDIVITSIDALLEADTQIDNLGEFLGLPLDDIFTSVVGYLSTVAPTLVPALKMIKIAEYAKKLTEPIREELQEKLAEPNLRQRLICDAAKSMVRDADITGEELANVIAAFNLTSTTAVFVSVLQQSWDLGKVSEILQIATNDIDCGCPELVQKEAGIGNVAPELATWAFKADFKLHPPSWYGFSTDYGDYVAGVGLNGAYDNSMTRNFAFIFKGLSNAMLERVDVTLANVVRGQFFSGEGTPDNDIEGFYMRHRFVGGNPISVVPIKTPITTKTIGLKASELTLQFMFGYDERDPNTIPDQAGFGTIESVVVWGRGTIPSDYNAWEQVYSV